MAETTEQYRARMNQLKTSIENEPLIKEMRSDIAEGISKTGNRQADIEARQDTLENDFVAVQQDASSASPSGAEVAIARAEFNTLDERLTTKEQEVTAQLEQKASKAELANQVATKTDKLYVDTQVQAMSSGAPKGVYPTLADLRNAFPTGNINIYVVSADGKWYYWNNLDWVPGGVYQGTVLNDNAVTSAKLERQYNYHGLLNNTNDLNTVMKTGVYWILNSNQPTNTPSQLAGKIYILRNEVFNSAYVLQTAFRYDNPSESYSRRIYISASPSITPWKKNSGGYQGILNSTTNLDTVNLDNGVYWIINNNQPLNTPPALANKIYVLKQDGFGEGYAIQTAYEYDNPSNIYVRRIYYSNGTKTDWTLVGSNISAQPLLGKKLLTLGDSNSANGYWQQKVAERTGATIVNNSFAGAKYSITNNPTYDPHSFYTLSSTADLTDIEHVFIMFGTNDYNNNIALGEPTEKVSTTIKGALYAGLENLLTRKPELKIFIASPIWSGTITDTQLEDSHTTPNNLGLYLRDYVEAIADVCKMFGVPFYNSFDNGGINKFNYTTYFYDYIHLNQNVGHPHMGTKWANFVLQHV